MIQKSNINDRDHLVGLLILTTKYQAATKAEEKAKNDWYKYTITKFKLALVARTTSNLKFKISSVFISDD